MCTDVLSFVFQTFDFQVLCFGFFVLCPMLLNGAMETKKEAIKWRCEYTCTIVQAHVLYFRLYVRFSATKKNKEKECKYKHIVLHI